jgi:hypothetical protein
MPGDAARKLIVFYVALVRLTIDTSDELSLNRSPKSNPEKYLICNLV